MFGIDVEFDQKKNGLLERNYIKAKEEMWPLEISELYCSKKLAVGTWKAQERNWQLVRNVTVGNLESHQNLKKKLTVERNNKESLKK